MFSDIVNNLLIMFAVYGLVTAAGIISERSGIVNIGLNANVTAGLLGSLIFHGIMGYGANGGKVPSFGVDILSLFGSALFGVVVAYVFSLATITLKGDHVIVGTALNILLPVVAFIVLYLDNKTGHNLFTSHDQNIGKVSKVLVDYKSGAFDWKNVIYFLIALVSMGTMWFVIRFTKIGLRIWASGENPHALAAAGVNVHRVRFIAQAIVGIMSGIAGGILLRIYSGSFQTAQFGVDGIGFIAIAMVVISQWRIHWGILVVLLFSIIQSTLISYQIDIKALIGAKEFFEIIPFVLPIAVLPFFSKVSKAPKHDGLIYDASQR